MSYEKGESLEEYRDRSSDAERNRIIEQLQSLIWTRYAGLPGTSLEVLINRPFEMASLKQDMVTIRAIATAYTYSRRVPTKE